MNDFTDMFDDSVSTEERMEKAAHILKLAADEEGVDLDSVPPEQVEAMMSHIMGEESDEDDDSDDDEDGDDSEEDDEGEEGKTASDITVADVSLEMHKRAAAEGIDLLELDEDTYAEVFDKVAAELTDPVVAEENEKWAMQVAQMDELGRVAARGFCDEIDKIAEGDDDEDDDDKKKRLEAKKEAALKDRAKAIGSAISGGAKKGWGHVRNAGGAVGRAAVRGKNHAVAGERKAHAYVGNKIPGGGPGLRTERDAVNRGRKITGGTAGVAGVGTGAGLYAKKRNKDKKKHASYVEQAALELARNTLWENGIDPDTGVKIASDEAISQRAYEMLAEAGYEV